MKAMGPRPTSEIPTVLGKTREDPQDSGICSTIRPRRHLAVKAERLTREKTRSIKLRPPLGMATTILDQSMTMNMSASLNLNRSQKPAIAALGPGKSSLFKKICRSLPPTSWTSLRR
jgi:hypothetical protein